MILFLMKVEEENYSIKVIILVWVMNKIHIEVHRSLNIHFFPQKFQIFST